MKRTLYLFAALILSLILTACRSEIPQPEIEIISPIEGELLTEDSALTFTVTAPEGVLEQVKVSVDNKPVQFKEVELRRFARFSVPLPLATLGNGEHLLAIQALATEDESSALAFAERRFSSALPPAELRSISLSPDTVPQGQPITIDAVFSGEVKSVTGELFDRQFPFYPVGENRWRALASCRLFAVPGSEQFHLTFTDLAGAEHSEAYSFAVVDGEFPSYHIVLSESSGSRLNAETIERESARTNAVVREFSPEQLWEPGPFLRPVEGGHFTSPFGQRRTFSTGGSSSHLGTDFGGLPTGTPIMAVARGKVVMAEEMIIRGNFVCIDHGRGLFSLYNHLSRGDVTVGQMVEAGDVIGLLGETGVATGPHLHLEMRLASWAVDPMTFLGNPPSYE